MAFFSCMSTLLASSTSMKQDLISIYEEEEQRLNQEKKHYTQMAEEKGLNLQDPLGEYNKNVHYPLQLCQKYLSILKNTITPDDTSTLIAEYEKWVEYNYLLEAKYLSNMLAAIYFDRRDEEEDYINLAIEFAKRPTEFNMGRREKAIHYYIRAKICKELMVKRPSAESNYGEFVVAGVSPLAVDGVSANDRKPDFKYNKALLSLFIKLAPWI